MKKYQNLTWNSMLWALLLIYAFVPGASGAAYPDSEAVARLWVQRLTATMEEHASPADVNRLLELYADDAVYEHPHAGARIEGKSLMREGMSSHLGETRSPKIRITRTIAGEDFAIVEFTLKMDMRQDSKWIPMQRRQVVVLELKGSRIQRINDHWSRLPLDKAQGR